VRTERAYLEHVLFCIGRIKDESSAGRAAVFASATLQDAILRNLQVLCESTQRLSAESKGRHPEVDWRGISAFRNVLVHSYFEVDFESVWSVVDQDLPGLEAAVKQMLEEPESAA
jgi:uncharacterized protein with HEPN domain